MTESRPEVIRSTKPKLNAKCIFFSALNLNMLRCFVILSKTNKLPFSLAAMKFCNIMVRAAPAVSIFQAANQHIFGSIIPCSHGTSCEYWYSENTTPVGWNEGISDRKPARNN